MSFSNSRLTVPLVGTLVLLGVFMGLSLWLLPAMHHTRGWYYSMDIWDYFQLAHLADTGAYSAIYGQLTLISTPGIVVVLAPLWWIAHVAGMSISYDFMLWHPTAWLILGPYEVLLSSSALFASDAVAVRVGAPMSRRILISAAEVYALYNVVLWGHPEDAVAVAFLLYGCLAAWQQNWPKFAWLVGVAVAFQPFVLLALPVLLVGAGWKRLPGLAVRLVSPSTILLVLPLAMDWQVTVHAFLDQVTYPSLNRPTPWLHFAPSLGHSGYIGINAVAVTGDGPSRLLAVLASLAIGIVFRRSWRDLNALVMAVALSLSLWCAFETVIAPYYVWPPVAVALISLSGANRLRCVGLLSFALVVDLASNADLHAEWVWWVIVAALCLLFLVSWQRAPVGRGNGKDPAMRRLHSPSDAVTEVS